MLLLPYKYSCLGLHPARLEYKKSCIPRNLPCQHVCFPAKPLIAGKQWIACSLFSLFRFYIGQMIPRKAQLARSESVGMWQPKTSRGWEQTRCILQQSEPTTLRGQGPPVPRWMSPPKNPVSTGFGKTNVPYSQLGQAHSSSPWLIAAKRFNSKENKILKVFVSQKTKSVAKKFPLVPNQCSRGRISVFLGRAAPLLSGDFREIQSQ